MFGANVDNDGTEATLGGGAYDVVGAEATVLSADITGMTEAVDSIRPTTFGRLAGNGAVLRESDDGDRGLGDAGTEIC